MENFIAEILDNNRKLHIIVKEQKIDVLDLLTISQLINTMDSSKFSVFKEQLLMDIRLTDVDRCAALVLERVNRYNAEHGIQHDTKHSALQLNLKSMSCSHCGKTNHNSDKCYLLHPELRPKPNNKQISKPIVGNKSQKLMLLIV